jgi:membrane protein required for colicin V production
MGGAEPLSEGDIGVLAIVAVSALLAFWRGFVREVLSVGSWVAAAIATLFGLPAFRHILRERIVDFPIIGDFLKDSSIKDLAADILTGSIIFIIVLIAASMVSHFLSRNIRTSMFNSVDRSLGAVFGVVRGVVLVCALFLIVDWYYPLDKRPAWVAESRSLPLVSTGADILRSLMPKDFFKQGTEAADAAQSTVDQLIGVGEITGVLPGSGDAATSPDESAGSPEDSGYKDAERDDLERLIQGTQ